ncbi:MAG: hypothetical protein IAI50_05345 [Candidatus Eremiobacteraeota bacterium]|nr:hypothetical protein [Candidatus Eremiobacteraeota bacterium]
MDFEMPFMLTLENFHFSLAMATAEITTYMDHFDNIARSTGYAPQEKAEILYDIEMNIRRCLHDNYHTLYHNASNGEHVTQESREVALRCIRGGVLDDMESKHSAIVTKIYQRLIRGVRTSRSTNENGELIIKLDDYRQGYKFEKIKCDE